jgi:general secretion pathway protein I
LNRPLSRGARPLVRCARPFAQGRRRAAGFTLVEVLVALIIVTIGLAALMITVSSTARTSGILRQKTLAQWMALNRLTEVRLNLAKFGQNTDTGEINFGNQTWHYDTRYFDTSFPSMKRVVVRIYAGDAKAKGNPVIESTGFVGTSLSTPGSSNSTDWTAGTALPTGTDGTNGTPTPTTPVATPNNPAGGLTSTPTPTTTPTTPATPTPTPSQ